MVNGKRAVVTGGANGIGLATARALKAGGAEVTIFDRERPANGDWQWIEIDVRRRESIDAAFAQVGTPDIVVANAGIAEEEEFLEHSTERWDRVLSINLSGAFHTMQAAARVMQGGAIVLTASTNSYDGEARLAAYNASKAGLLGLVHTAANELGPYGIRVNAVCPGLIRTRLTERHFASPEILRDYFRHIPLGRGGSPDEVAQAAVFLASDMASYVTGATLFVDGVQMASKFGTWSEETAEFKDAQWKLRDSP